MVKKNQDKLFCQCNRFKVVVAIHIPKPRRYRVSGPCTPVRGHPSPLQDYIEPLESISNIQYPKLATAEEKKDHVRSNCRGQTLGCHSSLNGNPAPQMKELSWMLPSHVSLSTCIVRSEPQIDLGLLGERHLLRGIYLKNQGTFDIPCFWQSWVMISFLLELLDPSKQRDITNHLFLSFYHTPIPIIPVSFGIMLSIAIPY